MCFSPNLRHVDAVKLGEGYCIQRLYTGIEPEQQTSREMKERFGVLAYAMTARQQLQETVEARYRLTVDGETVEAPGTRCYVINSGMTGKGLTLDSTISATDGLLDILLLNQDLAHVEAVTGRFLGVYTPKSGLDHWRGREVTIEADPDRAVWADGEHIGRTPVTATVVPGALAVVVP
jgi:diacylglycerol kinase family enzyme